MSSNRRKQGIDCVTADSGLQKLHIATICVSLCGLISVTAPLKTYLKTTMQSNVIKTSYQICYDVVVPLHVFSHTDSLQKKETQERDREREREKKTLCCYACRVTNQGTLTINTMLMKF